VFYFIYHSLQYVIFTCNVVVLHRITLYFNVGWHIRIRIRARAREWNYSSFSVLKTKTFAAFTLTVQHSQRRIGQQYVT